MKTRTLLWILLAVTLAASPKAIAQESGFGSGGGSGIPLPAGPFSFTGGGTVATCVSPTSGKPIPCSTAGVTVNPRNEIFTGAETRDDQGNACGTHSAVFSSLPVGASLPAVAPVHHVIKVQDYDAATGVGDEAISIYSGGTCNGVHFDGAGATKLLHGTLHFEVTTNGDRIDSVYTSLVGAPNVFAIGGVSETVTERRQVPQGLTPSGD